MSSLATAIRRVALPVCPFTGRVTPKPPAPRIVGTFVDGIHHLLEKRSDALIRWKDADAGYEIGKSKNPKLRDRNCCTVITTALVMGIPFADAQELLRQVGRKKHKGFVYANGAPKLGLKVQDEEVLGKKQRLYKALEKFSKGRFVFRIARHVFAVIDGVVHDDQRPKHNALVTAVYKWEPDPRTPILYCLISKKYKYGNAPQQTSQPRVEQSGLGPQHHHNDSPSGQPERSLDWPAAQGQADTIRLCALGHLSHGGNVARPEISCGQESGPEVGGLVAHGEKRI